jgi:serine/threonine protein kinase
MATKEEAVREVQAPLPSGAVIHGSHIIESQLGKGDFGTIYLVRDQHKKQKLFVLAEVFNPNEEESYRFTLEYVAPASLDHQALPAIQYVFNDEKLGRAYILMSCIEELTLEKLRLRQLEKRFPLPKVIAFMVPVIDALNFLHHQKPPVIHQNVNPNNIIVSRTLNVPVLIMLDLVKDCDSTTTALHYFAPGYGAPEQYGKEFSTRTDIYALGATCYTLLTGIIPPDALYRSTQLKNGEVDPLKPLDEVIPTIPAFMVEAIQRALSLNADDRFSSVQQLEHALIGEQRFQESPTLKLHPRLPEQNLSSKADSVEQKPLEPTIVPTVTTQTNAVKQQSPEPFLVSSAPTFQQAPVPEVPPLLAVTEKLPASKGVPSTLTNEELPIPEATLEVAPPVSISQKPPVPEEVTLIITDCEPSAPEIVPSTIVTEELPSLEVLSSDPTQSSTILVKDIETSDESLPRKPHTVLSRKPDALQPVSSRQKVEKSASTSMRKGQHVWTFGVLLIVFMLLIIIDTSADFWSHQTSHSVDSTQNVKASTLTPTPHSVSSIYPMLTGTYSGMIYDLSTNVSSSMLLSGIRQSQGNISGYLTLDPTLQGSGHVSGIIDSTNKLKFIVTDTVGHATLFFEGVRQSATNLTGDYYRCSPVGLSQGGQCKQAPGSYGIWDIVLLSSG